VSSQHGSSESHNVKSPTQILRYPIIEVKEPDDVLGSDEEDERMFPDLVHKRNVEQ
jgi:hypothetical protein